MSAAIGEMCPQMTSVTTPSPLQFVNYVLSLLLGPWTVLLFIGTPQPQAAYKSLSGVWMTLLDLQCTGQTLNHKKVSMA